jgi:peptide chain release factor subunit 3
MLGGLKIERPKTKAGFTLSLGNGTKIELKPKAETNPVIVTKSGQEIKTPEPAKPAEAPKPAPKKEEPKPAPKKEEPKPAPKKEEPKPAPKKEEPKPAPKKEEPKPAPKKEEPKPAPKKEEPKPAPKKEEPKPEEEEEEEEKYEGEILDETAKKHINIVFIGHVDAGKSTLCGHVLYQAGVVDQRTIEQYQAESAKEGRGSWYFSWVMDLSKEERAKGKTEEVGVARFETDVHKYTILDAPGHRSYVPQMIGGAVQADVAVLVISARAGEFEAGFEKGGQTSEHLLIAKTAGVRYVIIVVNKMDDKTVNWSQQRFDHIVKTFTPFITRDIGFKPDQFCFIPIAALSGFNIKQKSGECPWFQGKTLFETLDSIPLPLRNETDAFRLPVIDRYKTKSVIASGKLEKGIIREGDQIIVMPSGKTGAIQSIFVDENKIRRAVPGDNIRVALSGIDLADITSGSVICPINKPCDVATRVIGRVRITPSGPELLTAGYEAMCHIHTDTVPVIFDKLRELYIPGRKEPEKNPRFVRNGQTAMIILKFDHPICVEKFRDFPQLGRFIIRKEGFTTAIGIIEQLPKAK